MGDDGAKDGDGSRWSDHGAAMVWCARCGDGVGAERMQEDEDADMGGQMCGETTIGMVMVEVGGSCDGTSVARRGRGGIRWCAGMSLCVCGWARG